MVLKLRTLALTVLLALSAAAPAEAVGFQHVFAPDPDGAPLEVGIWYPSDAPAKVESLESFEQTVALDGAVAGNALPLVIIATDTGASYAGHYDTALALADAGFVVAAVAHKGDDWRDQRSALHIMDQPRQIVRVIDYLLGAWPGHPHVDPARIGIFGFGGGGFTALVDIGGEPDLPLIGPQCKEHPKDAICAIVSANGETSLIPPVVAFRRLHDKRIRAAVIAAPALGFTFTSESLKDVTAPVQLWRAADDTITPSPFYAEPVYDALPVAPLYTVVANAGHYDFLAPCRAALAKTSPAQCRSDPGFDRAAFPATFDRSVVAFFVKTLTAK